MPGRMKAPGQVAGKLSEAMAKKLGFRQGIPVSTAIIDAHAGVPWCRRGRSGHLGHGLRN